MARNSEKSSGFSLFSVCLGLFSRAMFNHPPNSPPPLAPPALDGTSENQLAFYASDDV
jgi:hypothetical protein